MNIAIVGSGLSAISAAKVLIKRGIKPTILDIGETLDEERLSVISRMSAQAPEEWNRGDRELVTRNTTVSSAASVKKLAFGSDYFYGDSSILSSIEARDPSPPFSTAKGGFSEGWGATVLPSDDCDLEAWPIGSSKLGKYYRMVLEDLPYSARNDELSANFPLFSKNFDPLSLSDGNRSILADLRNSKLLSKDQLVFGQGRLLVRSSMTGESSGCVQCGYCMSGCVYSCIYKSRHDLDKLIRASEINYFSGRTVKLIEEADKKVVISMLDQRGNSEKAKFDRIFLAAGAVGSTKIILQSKRLYNSKLLLKSTVGFIAPMLRLKRSPSNWPNTNTQPGIFLEYKVPGLSDHWVHTQLSTPNELVPSKLGITHEQTGLTQKIKRRVSEHLVIAYGNM